MLDHRVNLIDGIEPAEKLTASQLEQPQKLTKIRPPARAGRIIFQILVFILVVAIFFSANTIISRDSLITNFGRLSFWEGVVRLVIGQDKILKGELTDRINILILGMGGAEHEGPYLTDTIILASIKPSTNRLALLSIPRDLYVPIPDFGWRKINTANALGMLKSGDGAILTSKVVSDVLDIPIHYWLRVDFNIFRELIDELGGIEINVEKSFVDREFPGANFSYRVVSFETGWQTMDGQRALEFARSRHGTDNEGSDFARSRRQQKILFSIKEKIEQQSLLYQPQKIWKFYNILQSNVSSNLDLSQSIKLAKLISSITETNIITRVMEAGADGPLRAEISLGGAYILRPKTGNFKELAKIARNILGETPNVNFFGKKASGLEALDQPNQTNPQPITVPPPKVIILNGTFIAGLAKETSEKLEADNFEVIQIGNAPTRNWKKNTIYFNCSEQTDLLNQLQKTIDLEVGESLPPELKNIFAENDYDLLIVLGKE